MDAKYQKGQRLFVETEYETVEGEFYSQYQDQMIVLLNCILHPSGKALEGINRFYKNEIKSIKVLDSVPYPAADEDREVAGNWNLRHNSKIGSCEKPAGKVTVEAMVMNMPPGYRAREGRKPKLTVDEYDEATKRIKSNVLIERKGKFFMAAADLSKWRQRPLPHELQIAIVQQTVFLQALKEKLLAKMLHTFLAGVDIFLNIVKNAEPEDAHDHQVKGVLVPREFDIFG